MHPAMNTSEIFLIAMIIIFSMPYLVWRLGRTDYYAPLVVVQIIAGILLGPGVLGALFPGYSVEGVDQPERVGADLATQAASMFNQPVRLEVRTEQLEGKVVLVVFVPEAAPQDKPVYLKAQGLPRGAFRRIGSTDQRCTEDDLIALYQARQVESFDSGLVPDTTLDDLSPEAIADYRVARREANPDAEELRWSDEELLQALGAVRHDLVDVLQARDRLGNGLPVGQRATQPAVVHVILGRFLGGFGDGLLGLTLGADEKHAAALGDGVTNDLQRGVQHRDGLGQVENVDAVAFAIDELGHTGVPALGLVAVVNASFQELTHVEVGKRHVHVLSGLRLGRVFRAMLQPVDRRRMSPSGARPSL